MVHMHMRALYGFPAWWVVYHQHYFSWCMQQLLGTDGGLTIFKSFGTAQNLASSSLSQLQLRHPKSQVSAQSLRLESSSSEFELWQFLIKLSLRTMTLRLSSGFCTMKGNRYKEGKSNQYCQLARVPERIYVQFSISNKGRGLTNMNAMVNKGRKPNLNLRKRMP